MEKKKPKDSDPEPSSRVLREFTLVLGGYAYFEALVAGCRLGVFERLEKGSKGMEREEIAGALGISAYAARVLLLSLCSIGLLTRSSKGIYRNSAVARRLLLKDSPQNVLSVVDAHHHLIYRGMFHLTDAIRQGRHVGLDTLPGEGKMLYQRLASRPELEGVFQSWVQNIADRANPLLGRVAEFRRIRHLADIGGGNAANAIALHKLFPHLKITVFDLPSVCERARENIRAHGLSGSISTVAGDFFRDPFPGDADAFLFGHLVHIFGEENIMRLMEKAHGSLPRGGMAICFNGMTDDDETGPLRSADLSLYFLAVASGEGMVYPWKEFKKWYAAAGFRKVKTYDLKDFQRHGVVIGVK